MKKRKKVKGFTLVELTIVLAIMVIIGAIVLPNFAGTTERARVASDIRSAQIINNAINLCENETGNTVEGANAIAVITNLRTNGYLANNTPTVPQATGGAWEYVSDTHAQIRIRLNTTSWEIFNRLSTAEQAWIALPPTDPTK